MYRKYNIWEGILYQIFAFGGLFCGRICRTAARFEFVTGLSWKNLLIYKVEFPTRDIGEGGTGSSKEMEVTAVFEENSMYYYLYENYVCFSLKNVFFVVLR